ncbi:MAG: hypothetical protein AAGK21_07620 [Bacteroidota bacterium]
MPLATRTDALRPGFADEVRPAFELVIFNPPYIPDAERPSLQREVRDHEPEALCSCRTPTRSCSTASS